ncbi:MAG: nucleotidyltransferase domain-containing protein [Candidatus Helarchaeota archaeon]
MVTEEIMNQLKRDFRFLEKNPSILGSLLYGSHVSDQATPNSDIDICLVTPNQDLHHMYNYVMENSNSNFGNYDIRFFEELSLHVQAEIIENGIIIYCPDEPTLFEYFFKYRKRWADLKYRLDLYAT